MTDKELGEIVNDMVVIVDTREQKNQHILDYLNDNEIKWVRKKVDTGDYTFELPNYPNLNLDRQVLVEKKNSLSEIAGNFTTDRGRFQREFERLDEEDMHLVIENATWRKIANGSYRSKLHPNAFTASLLSWAMRYDFKVWFVQPQDSPQLIYNLLKYGLIEKLKELS